MHLPRRARPICVERISTLTTARLLAYRDRLLTLEESVDLSDWNPTELTACDPALIYFKSDPRWQPLYDEVRQELARRPT